jgi:hypothetical protein
MEISRLLVFAMSGLLTTAEVGGQAGLRHNRAQASARTGSGELQLVVDVDKSPYRAGEEPSFRISFRNSGNDNLLLNGGELLGNGAEIWSAIRCEFRAADGQRWPLSLGWGVPGIAGRIYFLGVPLRAGGSYTISVTPKDYYLGKSEHLGAGIYGLSCTYTGAQSPPGYRDSTQLPLCWEGLATSNSARVEVLQASRMM